MTDGTTLPDSTYKQSPYTLTTTDIETVSTVQATTYEFAGDDSFIDMSDPPKWSTASPTTYNIGTNPAIEARHGLYKSSIGVVWGLNDPIYSSTTRNIYVFWSDTGEDWTQQNAPAGDELWNQYELNVALGGGYTSNHEYFMVYNGGKFTFSLWAIQEAKKINTLTFPGDVSANPDLNYFEVGDAVIAGSDGKTWTGTTANANNYGVSDPAILFDDHNGSP